MPSNFAFSFLFSRLTALAALGTCAFAVQAQQAVLFGIVDVNARSVKNGSAPNYRTLSSDGINTSRIGVRGNEDLGDGQKAGFWLEAAVLPDVGGANATKFWNRRATVGLSDPNLGELRAGRDTVTTFNALGTYDAFGTNGLGEVIGNGTSTGIVSLLGSGAATLTRADNQVSYFTPATLGGIYGQVSVAPGEGTPGNKLYAGRLGYAKGPVNVSVAYTQTTVVLDDKYKQLVVGGSYDFGFVRPMAQWVQSKYASAAGGNRRQNVIEVGAVLPIGPYHEFHAGYVRGDMKGGATGSGYADADDAHQYALSYLYKFSKTTAIYATAARLENKGALRLALAAGAAGFRAGENSTGYEAGIRNAF